MIADEHNFYDALAARDARFDGVFFVGVTTTGIYCRPVCVARTPGRDRCRFFGAAAEAEKAGYRACFRCRPEVAPGHASVDAVSRLVGAALSRVDDGFLNLHNVSALASALGVTDRHLRRAVETEVGVSLVELAQSRRLAMARRLVVDSRLSLIQVAHASGFGSLRRFNALFVARTGRAPSTLRRSAATTSAATANGTATTNGTTTTAGGRGRRREATAVADPPIALRLDFRPPYRWRDLLAFLGRRAIAGVEVVTGDEYRRCVRIGDDVGTISVRPDGSRASLRAEISPSLIGHVMKVVKRLRAVFDLDARPDLIAERLGADPLLAPLLRCAPGIRLPGAFDAFEVAARAVLGQQISVRAATTVAGRLAARFGAPLPIAIAATAAPGPTQVFPPARVVAAARVEELAALGLPVARAATLRDVAALFDRADFLAALDAGDRDEVTRRLIEVRGIGAWTAAYVVMRALHDPDAFPAGDLGIRRALGGLSERAATARAEAWRPWRSYAVMHLWASLEASTNEARGEHSP